MLRRVGMSLLLSWICLSAFAQLPHPSDTLENGKKVPFNQFLSRFSVFNEFFGTTYPFSLNLSYSLVKSEILIFDFTAGAGLRPRRNSADFSTPKQYNEWSIPISLRLTVGRRKSRFTTRLGYVSRLYPSWFTDEEQAYPGCGHHCPTPPRHSIFLSAGYTYQHQYGFYAGLHVYGTFQFPLTNFSDYHISEYLFPMGGLTVGYRLPSKQLHNQWIERGFKRRVLRIEDKKEEREKKYDEIDAVFYTDEPLEIDSVEMKEIEVQLAKVKKRHERYLKEEQRLNGRSHVFGEFFGAGGIWSINYSYTHPIGKSKVFAMDYRGGLGTDTEDMAMPFHVGVKAMKNYRGSGVYIGAEPRYNWVNGKVGLVYFVEHNVEFHFAYGLTGGVAFYFFYDPSRFLFERDWAPYGGFFLGYRLPQMKKA